MKYRKTNRLKGYDYSECGCYFITICTQNKVHYFGEITNGIMVLNETGKIAAQNWESITKHFQKILLDEFVIMPNHIHGIICITDDFKNNSELLNINPIPEKKMRRNKMLISKIVQQYKSSVSREINKSNNTCFKWQRSFYDHIIRNERSFKNIQSYIHYNPINWAIDLENNKNQFKDLMKYYNEIITGKK